MTDAKRIDAPASLIKALEDVRRELVRLQSLADGLVLGAALDKVPEGWQWDGAGWSAPSTGKEEIAGE